jgi:hypothetical protein
MAAVDADEKVSENVKQGANCACECGFESTVVSDNIESSLVVSMFMCTVGLARYDIFVWEELEMLSILEHMAFGWEAFAIRDWNTNCDNC